MGLENIGIFYNAGYLIQGNQIERCKKSLQLNVGITELLLRSDKKDCDIKNIKKVYKGSVLFHLPSINPDLDNLKTINELVRVLVENDIKMVTINASNLSLDLFEWSTLDEQKKYFLNIVTSIATLASNKIEVLIDNLSTKVKNPMFGSNITQITDIIIYSRKMLIKDFGFKEDMAKKYINLSLNIDNIDVNEGRESLENWFEIFKGSISCIKISDINNADKIRKAVNIYEKNCENPLILLKTNSDLDYIDSEYIKLTSITNNNVNIKISEKNDLETSLNIKKISNIIIIGMIVLTLIILCMMFIIKLK